MNYFKIGAIALAVLLVSYLTLFLVFRTRIEADEIGVWRTNYGQNGLSDYQIKKGFFPVDFSRSTVGYIIPGKPWVVDNQEFQFESVDRTTWKILADYQFTISPESAIFVAHRNVSNLNALNDPDEFLAYCAKRELMPVLRERINFIIQTNRDTLIETQRLRLSNEIEAYMVAKADSLGYIINNFSLNFFLPKALKAIAEAKAQAIAQAAITESQLSKLRAETEIALATAKAEAERKIIEARAIAEANRIITQSLTTDLVKLEWIKKWNGEPTPKGVAILNDLK